MHCHNQSPDFDYDVHYILIVFTIAFYKQISKNYEKNEENSDTQIQFFKLKIQIYTLSHI